MTAPAEVLILNEIKIARDSIKQAADMWHSLYQKTPDSKRCLYISDDDILEISAQEKNFKAENFFSDPLLYSLEKKLENSLLSDWKRQILVLKDIVKPQDGVLPTTPFVQLRHIEVPLKVYNSYLEWRKKTIFKHIKNNSKVDSFVAYHSLFSAEPGVTFFSGFTCDPNDYSASFNTVGYQEIVQQAGNQFICGGEKSLHTKIYQKI